MMQGEADRRHGDRNRVALEGAVVWADGRLRLDCAVRDLSEEGARLVFRGPAVDCDTFLFALDGARGRPAHRVWASGREMGIAFD